MAQVIAVDFDYHELPRKMKPLGQIYRAICRDNAINSNGAL